MILIPTVLLWSRKRVFPGLSPAQKAISLVVRCLVLSLIIFALSGLSVKKSVDDISAIFAIDYSDSVTSEGKEKALSFVEDSLYQIGGKDTAGILVFGADALVERYPVNDYTLGYVSSIPKTNLTNISQALSLGAIIFPQDSRKHLILLSDGNESIGNTDEALKLLKVNNIRLSAIVLPSLKNNEVIMTSFKTPSFARIGEVFNATVKVESDVATEGYLHVLQNDDPVKSVPVRIDKGINEYTVELEAKNSGFRRFRALIEPKIDHWAENNEAHSITLVEGPPNILIVEGVPGESINLVEALKNSSIKTNLISPQDMPVKASGLANHQTIVLVNVSAEQLGNERMNAIKSYVRDMGGGLVVIGGNQSFGIGGYRETPLDEALPVKSDIQGRRRLPTVAVVLVIDKSGSMGQCHCASENRDGPRYGGGPSKVELAKVAIMGAVKELGAKDYFGVVAVDDKASWVVPLKRYKNKDSLYDAIGTLTAYGGQVLEAGLKEAENKLRKTDAQIKHVIMLTDGWTGMNGLYPIIDNMRSSRISFSSVAAGGGSSHVLEDLAKLGLGRYYPMTDDYDIPAFITKETALVARPYVNQVFFYPKIASLSPIIKSTGSSGVPPLYGYITTTPKARSEVVLVSNKDDPVLATWQYGLGTAVAWTSDAKNQWSSNWVKWGRFDEFWSTIVRSCIPQKRSDDLISSVEQDGKDAVVTVSLKNNKKKKKTGSDVVTQILKPDNSTELIRLEETLPGKFEGKFEASQKGTYLLTASLKSKDGTTSSQMLGHVVSYTPEYRFREPNRALLARLVSATGGKFLDSPDEVFSKDLPPYYSLSDLSNYLLLLAFILFFLDIAVRRIIINLGDFGRAKSYVRGRLSGTVSKRDAADKVEKGETLSRLEEAKKRAAKRWER